MIVAIHQPHYFPWLGYLDKIAKADCFMYLNQVQLTLGSNMYRNRVLATNGETKFLTVPFERGGYLNKPFSLIEINNSVDWQRKHINFLQQNYRRHPYFDEIYESISFIFEAEHHNLSELTISTVDLLCKLYSINTTKVLQPEIHPEMQEKKGDLVLHLCKTMGATKYLSGIGAKKYMDDKIFITAGIEVEYQQYEPIEYFQKNSNHFNPNVSALDMLFNLGIDNARDVFWQYQRMERIK